MGQSIVRVNSPLRKIRKLITIGGLAGFLLFFACSENQNPVDSNVKTIRFEASADSIIITWEDPDVRFDSVVVSRDDGEEEIIVARGTEKAIFHELTSGESYRFDISIKHIDGTTRTPIEIWVTTHTILDSLDMDSLTRIYKIVSGEDTIFDTVTIEDTALVLHIQRVMDTIQVLETLIYSDTILDTLPFLDTNIVMDTVVDTVRVTDTSIFLDTVLDTTVFYDTSTVVDTQSILDTSIIKDTQIVVDTNQFFDTTTLVDTTNVFDTTQVWDTTVIIDTLLDTSVVFDTNIVLDTQIVLDSQIVSDTLIDTVTVYDTTTINLQEVTNLTARVNRNTVSLTWDDPSGADSIEIVKTNLNSGISDSQWVGIGSETISYPKLSFETNYKFIVSVVYGSFTTIGLNVYTATGFLAPGEVSGVLTLVTGKNLKFTWTNPLDSDLDSITVVISDTSGFSDTVSISFLDPTKAVFKKLIPNRFYTYSIRTQDTLGNISSGLIGSVMTGDPSSNQCGDPDIADSTVVEICDGEDNNCNRSVDEGFDLDTDNNNCGKCGVVCGDRETCQLGKCG